MCALEVNEAQTSHSPFLPCGSWQFSWMHGPQADQEDTTQSVEQGMLQSWEAAGAGPRHNVLSTGLKTKAHKNLKN